MKYENHPHYAVLKACACGTCNKNRIACGCADCLPYATKNRKKRKRKARELNAFASQASKLAAADEIINGDLGPRSRVAEKSGQAPVIAKQAYGNDLRIQQMVDRQLERTWRTSENPAEREYAHQALLKRAGGDL